MTYEITVMVRYSGVVLPTLDYLSQNHPYNNFSLFIHHFFSVVPAPLVVLSPFKRFSLCDHNLRDYVPKAYNIEI